MSKMTDNVLQILHDYPITRDDVGLLSLIYSEYYYFRDYASFIMDNLQPQIDRISRKLQEEYPELRGEKYEQRQKHASKVRKEIKTPFWKKLFS